MPFPGCNNRDVANRQPIKKAVKLLNELMQHPHTGTGHPEQLKGDRAGQTFI